jgi:hypothetical protein
MIITNTGGPILFGSLILQSGRNELSAEQAKSWKDGLDANPGWAHAADLHWKTRRLYEGEPVPKQAKPSPLESAEALAAREAAEAQAEAEQIAELDKLNDAELDAAFASAKSGRFMDAIVATMKERAKNPPVVEPAAQVEPSTGPAGA